jgi:hypothetical protein
VPQEITAVGLFGHKFYHNLILAPVNFLYLCDMDISVSLDEAESSKDQNITATHEGIAQEIRR